MQSIAIGTSLEFNDWRALTTSTRPRWSGLGCGHWREHDFCFAHDVMLLS